MTRNYPESTPAVPLTSTRPALIFLPSPLLGPSVWRPVARILADQGWQTVICEGPSPVATGDDVLNAFRAALPVDRDLIVVPHSNAGAYVPELSVDFSILAMVFVDAVLPPPSGRMPLAPTALLDVLRERAEDDGVLPPWTQWWDETAVEALFPDAPSRAAVEREQQRIPLTYLESERAVPAGWDGVPGAFLAFGDTYAAESDDAARRGWPVRTLHDADHLHQVVAPDQVAEALSALLGRLGIVAVEMRGRSTNRTRRSLTKRRWLKRLGKGVYAATFSRRSNGAR